MAPERSALKKKAASGVVLLSAKRVVLQVIFTTSNIFLARLLFPADFGTFAIVGSIGLFFNVFADLGLVPSLIQKKGAVKVTEMQTAFTLQAFLGLMIVGAIFLTAELLSGFFGLEERGVILLKLYSLKFLIDPFRQVPLAILERGLQYKKIVMLDILVTLVGSGSTVFLAFSGLGVYSFAYGLVISHITSALLLRLILRWPIGIAFSRQVFLNLTKFGLPFQLHVILGLFYGPLILLYLGKAVGQTNLGLYQFAASLSVFPIAFAEILNRVIFPLGARTQADRAFLKQAIERSLVLVSMTTMPAIFFIGATAGQIIHYVYTDRWLAALPALYFGLAQMGIIAYTGVFGQFLLARGQAGIMRNIGLVWAALTWILAPILIAKFNFVGMNMTGLLVSASGIWLFFRLKREARFNFGENFITYGLLAALSSLVIIVFVNLLPQSFSSLVFALVSGAIVYFVLLVVFAQKTLRENLELVISMFFKQKSG